VAEVNLKLAILTALIQTYGPIPTLSVARRLSAKSRNVSPHWSESVDEAFGPGKHPLRRPSMQIVHCIEYRSVRLREKGGIVAVLTATGDEYELEAEALTAATAICSEKLIFFLAFSLSAVTEADAARILNAITGDGAFTPEDVLRPRLLGDSHEQGR